MHGRGDLGTEEVDGVPSNSILLAEGVGYRERTQKRLPHPENRVGQPPLIEGDDLRKFDMTAYMLSLLSAGIRRRAFKGNHMEIEVQRVLAQRINGVDNRTRCR